MNNLEESNLSNNGTLPGKKLIWQTAIDRSNNIADKIGTPIDAGIKDIVVALMVYGFPTSQSCEGHANNQQSSLYPWIEIYSPEPDAWQNNEAQKEAWRTENLKQQKKMIELLSEFYQNRKTSFDAQLCIQYVGAFGGFRIHSTGADILSLLPPIQQQKNLNLYRQEITDFSKFLKDKFFSR
ncbi:MAG: hypothetical protein V1807_02130 [Patescibacteria group bacterium]